MTDRPSIFDPARSEAARSEAPDVDYLCEPCRHKGRLVEAVEVHHVVPLHEGGDPFPPLNGLEALCGDHHYSAATASDAVASTRRPDCRLIPDTGGTDEEGAIPKDRPFWRSDLSSLPAEPGRSGLLPGIHLTLRSADV